MQTEQLISALSQQAKAAPHRPAVYWSVRMGVVLALYAAVAQGMLHVRSDLGAQLLRPAYALELLLLLALAVCGLTASVSIMQPDVQVRRIWLNLPYLILAFISLLLLGQMALPTDPAMHLPLAPNGMECAICIAGVALMPASLLFAMIRRGANVHPWRAGSYAALTAAAVGSLTLRLAEANDFLPHLVLWHYLPTLGFSTLGAWAGYWLLRW